MKRIVYVLFILFSFAFLYAQNVEDFESGGFGNNPWTFGGVADWIISSSETHSGSYSAQAGDISDSQMSSLSITLDITDASQISFWWKTSSENNYDWLRFYIDDVQIAELCGETGWEEVTNNVIVGNHTFKWQYEKDSSVSSGQDTGWIDDITFPTTFIYDDDMACSSIAGPAFTNVGSIAVYDITVKNAGYNTVNSYDVVLYNGNDEIETISINQALAFEETRVHSIPWSVPASEEDNTVMISAGVVLNNDENNANDFSSAIPTHVFPPGIIEIQVGNGTTGDNKTPTSFSYANSMTEMLYFSDEIAMEEGTMTSLEFQYNFSDGISDENIQIWLGETTQENLSTGFIFADELQLVYDGTPYFVGDSQNNWVNIEFDESYEYSGGNLVMLVYNPFTSSHTGTFNFIHDESSVSEHEDRTRYNRDNVEEYDPYDPESILESYTYEYYPNVKFNFYTGPKGILEGYVYDQDGTPVGGVEITSDDVGAIVISEPNGHYYFPDIAVGEHDFTANKYGYDSDTHSVEIIQDETTELDFTISEWNTISVSGTVYTSDDLDTPLAGAVVTLSGGTEYQYTTHQSGTFNFNNVYTNAIYQLTITYEGYQDYTSEVEVEDEDIDLGDLVVVEPTVPPSNVTATQNEDESIATISWNSPGVGGSVFRYDDGEPVTSVGLNTNNGVLGALHQYNSVLNEISWFLTDSHNHSSVKLLIFGLNEDGMPDQSNILYNSGTILNTDNQWNTHIIPEPIAAPGGFFVGICANGTYTDIALDDGVGAPYEYQDGTHFAIQNYTDSSDTWFAMEEYNVRKNMLLRVTGANYGAPVPRRDITHLNRSFEGYNIYRLEAGDENYPDDWVLVTEAITDTTYADETWQSVEEGYYKYAVKSRYTNNFESFAIFSGILNKTFSSAEGNELTLQNVTNYPNPFGNSADSRSCGTNISFSLASAKKLNVRIYNSKGQLVRNLIEDKFEAGKHNVYWDGKDNNLKQVTSGVYLYKIRSSNFIISKKMLLIK